MKSILLPIPLLEYPFKHYPPIYTYVYQVVSFPQVSPPTPCMQLSYDYYSITLLLHFVKKISLIQACITWKLNCRAWPQSFEPAPCFKLLTHKQNLVHSGHACLWSAFVPNFTRWAPIIKHLTPTNRELNGALLLSIVHKVVTVNCTQSSYCQLYTKLLLSIVHKVVTVNCTQSCYCQLYTK